MDKMQLFKIIFMSQILEHQLKFVARRANSCTAAPLLWRGIKGEV
jgi:hypothetical protein